MHNLQFLSMILTIGEIENQQNTKVYEHSATEANLPFRLKGFSEEEHNSWQLLGGVPSPRQV